MQDAALLSLSRWLAGVRVGLIAYRLARAPGDDDKKFRNDLHDALAAALDAVGARNTDKKIKDSALRSLPLQTLHALANPVLDKHVRSSMKGEVLGWQAAMEFVAKPQKDGRPPLINSSKLIAHLILEGLCSPHFLIQCGRIFVGDNWRWLERETGWKAAAGIPLAKLRATAASSGQVMDTLARIEALDEFRNALPTSGLQHWRLVENAVYHQLFSWPLLIMDPNNPATESAFSVPVAVDVMLDNTNHLRLEDGGIAGGIDPTEWRRELALSTQVAKDLWRSKHGGLLFSFREMVRNASVTFDFRLAHEVVRGLPFGFDLVDKSMGAYFAQVVLHRILGRSSGFTCAVSGDIAAQRRWPDGSTALDYEFDAPGGIPQKMRYVFESRFFSKLVLPANSPTAGSPDAEHEAASTSAYLDQLEGGPVTEVNYCPYLSNVADAVQTNGWRQYIYIRCPDVVHAMHRKPAILPPPDNPGVERIRNLLSTNEQPILRLPSEASLAALLSYLRHINFVEREEIEPDTPPSLSWAFIRATDDENDRRFWQTVWRAIGASREDFTLFRHVTGHKDAAKLLATALNTFSPRESCPSHRAPDVLVVLAAKRLLPEEWKRDALSYRSHIFPSVLGALGEQTLLSTPIEAMRRYIGKTRILVLEHGEYDVGGEHPPSMALLDPEAHDILERLSTFRFGFTQQMGSVLLHELEYAGADVRDHLKRLTQSGYLGEGSGEYWVRGNIGADLTCGPAASPETRAEWHWAAAKAFAPYLSASAVPGLDFTESFLPENVHEASFHLERAVDYLKETDMAGPAAARADRLRRSIRIAHGRTLRFIELPSAGVVQDLTRDRFGLSSRAAWEMASELLEEKERLQITPAPLELVVYARAGASWLDDVMNDPSAKVRRDEMTRTVVAFYEDALRRCQANEPQDDQRRLGVLTNYGHFLVRHGAGTERPAERLEEIRLRIAELVGRGVESATVEAKWFEIEGDRFQESGDAAKYYRDGTRLSPRYFTCWVKFAGTRRKQAVGLPDVVKELSNLPLDLRQKVYSWSLNQKLPIKSGLDSPWVDDRWKLGVEALKYLVEQ
jgi:hypothetical protein